MEENSKIELEEKLKKLKKELADLKARDPSHCAEKTFIDHPIPPELFQKIEDLEEEIESIEKKLKE